MAAPDTSAPRSALAAFIEAPLFQHFITAVILVNAVTLGLETSEAAMAAAGSFLVALDRIALAIFVVELGLKLAAWRLRFFRDGWNLFDFAVVAIALVPAAGPLSVLRALRILRVLRLLSVVPSMRKVVASLIGALPGMGSIIAVLLLVFYVGAVLSTKLFGDAFPDWFGTIGGSMYSLFQIMTLESWSMGIVRPVMEAYPYAWVFFVPFIILTSFMVLNLFIAIIVNSMQALHEEEHNRAQNERDARAREERVEIERRAHEERQATAADVRAIKAELAEVRRLLEARAKG
ncbi:ion transporter [Parvibaculum sp.]|jgi:voltage-gated sodium channel|uniref:ion transporter n=1 Tax=Parvibaculum sp. TaxID=2024848 RepID=UPI000C6423AF|nr:ion transporter [Parvibaculum sp.]MAU59568.1 ion transporter [Parvibaculum sp.]MBO6667904.1 ion transporter [Parvibaculum sp.]MBO6690517.1 ion transporter [Parvibaculum sp.]MBO6714860.1 ion transporter [Parvibaculum sp.]|tara:strand:+ start:2866 stop:3738 length:873 start_codon:yes stop_codon:yes gene_type:complete